MDNYGYPEEILEILNRLEKLEQETQDTQVKNTCRNAKMMIARLYRSIRYLKGELGMHEIEMMNKMKDFELEYVCEYISDFKKEG